jgi:hypothetical protein
MIATSVLSGMKPTYSRQKFLFDRVNELNRRVQFLFFASGLEESNPSLPDGTETGLQAPYIGTARHHRRSDKVKSFFPIKARPYPKLVEDILLLLVEEISPHLDLEGFATPNDITTLKSMRL